MLDVKLPNYDYHKVSENASRTLEVLEKQLDDINEKNENLSVKLNNLKITGINPNANFTKEEFEKANGQIKTLTDNVFELTQISNEIFDTYSKYASDSMAQISQYSSELAEAMDIMKSNQDRLNEIKTEIIQKTQSNKQEVEAWLNGIQQSFVQEIQSRLAIQSQAYSQQTSEFIDNLWAIKELELSKLARFQVQALLKIIIVNLSTQLLIENLAIVIKEKIEKLDDTRVLLTQELTFMKNSLSLFQDIYYLYNYGNT